MAKFEITVGHIYLIALAEWGVTPEYINEHWTEELLLLLFTKRKELKLLDNPQPQAPPQQRLSPNTDFFKKHGIVPKQIVVAKKA